MSSEARITSQYHTPKFKKTAHNVIYSQLSALCWLKMSQGPPVRASQSWEASVHMWESAPALRTNRKRQNYTCRCHLWLLSATSLNKNQYLVNIVTNAGRSQLTCRGEGVGVALMEAAGKTLQHSLSLLGLSYQHHYFQERPDTGKTEAQRQREVSLQHTDDKRWQCMQSVPPQLSPQGLIQSLSGEVKEFEVFFSDRTTEVIAM